MVMVAVVFPACSVRTSVLMVSGHSGPQDSLETRRSGGLTSRYSPRISISLPLEWRQTKCQEPPGRRSTSQTGIVQPSGPSIQWGRYLGLVQASKTSLRGAWKTRVMRTSRSAGVVTVKDAKLLIGDLL